MMIKEKLKQVIEMFNEDDEFLLLFVFLAGMTFVFWGENRIDWVLLMLFMMRGVDRKKK